MKIIKIDGNGWKLMKVDETGWDDWKWMEVDESGQENLEIIPKCCSPLPPLLLLLVTPFDWGRQNIGYYEFLQNSSRLIAYLGHKAVRLGVGTTRNEQLHYELKFWMRNIRMSHLTRFYICIRVFVLMKLLVHSSACYSPTWI